jgi:hypothetical protein
MPHFWLTIIFVSFLFACKKKIDDVQTEMSSNSAVSRKVTAWLDDQLAIANTDEKRAKIQSLKENLSLEQLWEEDFSDGEKFVVVPVQDRFRSDHNGGKNTDNVMLFVVNKAGVVRKGYFVQYLPEKIGDNLPKNAFYKMYNFKQMDASGTFTIMNVADKKMYEYVYNNGKLNRHSYVQKDTASNKTGSKYGDAQRTTGCTDWYWVTTYADGSQDWVFLYTTCNSCDPTMIDCPGGGGGGGSNFEEEEFATRQKAWDVAVSTYGLWVLTSTESFTGNRTSGTSGKFTNVSHVQDLLFPTNQQVVTWAKSEINTWGKGTSTAHARIKGRIQASGGAMNYVDEQKDFPFGVVFN